MTKEKVKPIIKGEEQDTLDNSIKSKNILKTKVIWEWIANLTLSVFYSFFVLNNVHALIAEFRLSILLVLLFNTGIMILALTRRIPKDVSVSPFDWLITMLGTLFPLTLIALPAANDHVALLALQSFGIAFSMAGLISLRRSFGLVPANRGIVKTGMYRYVRHPLYTGYILSLGGFVLQNLSVRNISAYLLFILFESLRLLAEERFLSKDDEYVEYTKRTHWRVMPYIW